MLSQLLSYSPPLPPPITPLPFPTSTDPPPPPPPPYPVASAAATSPEPAAPPPRPPKCSLSLDGAVVRDVGAAALATGVALGILRFWEELAKRGVFEQKLSRKLVHISIGMAFLLFWPIFSSESYAPFLAALAPGINIIRMLLLDSV
uniref:Uncharacterized protein n=1 Tax=Ananas comosus var. bracteatus TaxID=296719 RepID=A0A6V7QSK6_ANACO